MNLRIKQEETKSYLHHLPNLPSALHSGDSTWYIWMSVTSEPKTGFIESRYGYSEWLW